MCCMQLALVKMASNGSANSSMRVLEREHMICTSCISSYLSFPFFYVSAIDIVSSREVVVECSLV
jgi:hypothetical protein